MPLQNPMAYMYTYVHVVVTRVTQCKQEEAICKAREHGKHENGATFFDSNPSNPSSNVITCSNVFLFFLSSVKYLFHSAHD